MQIHLTLRAILIGIIRHIVSTGLTRRPATVAARPLTRRNLLVSSACRIALGEFFRYRV
jgi:hypothetical protein